MMTQAQNDIFYTAAVIEYAARLTKNKRALMAELIGVNGAQNIYQFAEVSHCLPFAQVADEIIEDYNIPIGDFKPEDVDVKVPSASEIGKVYMRLVEDSQPNPEKYPEALIAILKSKISDWMTDYRSAFYYSPRDYVLESYREIQNMK